MVLTLIAEVLSGETLITPGGPVDMDTASGAESFTWDGWLEQLPTPADEATIDLPGRAVTSSVEALTL
ncbi:MAG TPA: hypothetical protein VGQ42_09295 [Candidatus Dormibacteraeota bacterium]|nr:hypothetical protein [Candidatus Dormibacteraeota bacterium]